VGAVDTLVLAGEVEVPVAVEVAVGLECAEFEDGLGAGQAPAGAADVEAVADQMPACALDHPGGDRPAAGQRGVVVEELLFGLEVADAVVDPAPPLAGQSGVDGLLVDGGDGLGGVPGQDADRMGGDPRLGVGITVGVKAPGGLPPGKPRGEVPMVQVLFRVAPLRTTRAPFRCTWLSGDLRRVGGDVPVVDGLVAGVADHEGLAPFPGHDGRPEGLSRFGLPRLVSLRTWWTTTRPGCSHSSHLLLRSRVTSSMRG